MIDEQPLTQRRQIPASLGSLALLSGCLGGPAKSPTGTTTTIGTNIPESESTESGQAATTTNDCGRVEFCEGPELVHVRVDSGFSGKVVLSPACRENDIGLSPGETETLIRQADTETCDMEFLAGDEVIYGGRTQDYEYVIVRVSSGGGISLQKEVL